MSNELNNKLIEQAEYITNVIRQHAKEKAIAFGEWVDINAIRNGEHEWKYRGDNYTKKYTTAQLYEIFNQQNTGGITP